MLTPEIESPVDEPAVPQYCLLHRHVLPDRFPVQPRPELAVRRPALVGLRGAQQLLCGCEHAGPHLWPDGDEAEELPGDPPPDA
jgi:hypothetical protein